MANEAATAKDSQFKLISLLPDVCLTPGKTGYPIPYVITHTMDMAEQCSPNVFFRGKPAYLHNESYVDKVRGDEPGQGKGVVSQTSELISHSIDRSHSVYVNGQPLVRTGDAVWMNWARPAGSSSAAKTKTKAQRWQCRKGQIAGAKDTLKDMPPGPERDRLAAATERFERNNVAVEKARLSADTYDPSKGPPEGWKNVSEDPDALAKVGLKPENLEKPGSEFRAQAYEPDPVVFGDDMKTTIAFKGTAGGEDWTNNIAQGLDRDSPYYRSAVDIGIKLDLNGSDVDFTGHSLGGGQASAASRASGLPATTFNSAGLHPNTVARYGGTPMPSTIDHYRIAGEILGGVQSQNVAGTLGAAAVGAWVGGPLGAAVGALAKVGVGALMPDALGTLRPLSGHGSPLARHGMDQVIAGIEQQKSEDQAILAAETGRYCT